jgi:glycosyltransferase involved in cell wall biosynthesis
MKICFLANANSIHSFKWIKYFVDRGHKVYWFSFVEQEFEISNSNIDFYLLKNFSIKPINIAFNLIKFKGLIKKIKPDVLHSHYAGVNGILGALSGFHPFILTVWGSDILITAKSRLIKPFIKFALNRSDLITCDAEHMRNELSKLGVDSKKVRIIYFGIDTDKFAPGMKDEKLIKELGLKNNFVVISLRNLEPIYDIETLIKSIPFVLKKFYRTKFIVIGRGSEEEKLKMLAKSLGVENNLLFLGFISNDDLYKYLRIADIYVSTSLSDAGISASTAEAMACGLPVIITNTGENQKWVKNGESGFLIPTKSPEKLAIRIIELLKNEKKRNKFGLEARKIIEQKNNYYKEMEKMERIYEEIFKKI